MRTSFCENLHAKCYVNEREAIVTSMNLYEFSQVNNHEMGIYVTKADDPQLYEEIYTEARRLIRISEEIRVSVKKVAPEPDLVADKKPAEKKAHRKETHQPHRQRWLLHSVQKEHCLQPPGPPIAPSATKPGNAMKTRPIRKNIATSAAKKTPPA